MSAELLERYKIRHCKHMGCNGVSREIVLEAISDGIDRADGIEVATPPRHHDLVEHVSCHSQIVPILIREFHQLTTRCNQLRSKS